jgi:hypothetical protein
MSDVTDTRCEVSKGDLTAGASVMDVSVASVSLSDSSSSSSSSVSSLPSVGTSGTASAGNPAVASCTVEEEDSRCRSDRARDCGRSSFESGRGVISEASSKSYTAANLLANLYPMFPLFYLYSSRTVLLTPSLSELCELVGLSFLPSMFAGVGGVVY